MTVRDVGVGWILSTEGMFEAFSTTKSGGMGIGLSVSRSIVEAHDGRLWATPNGGPGALVSIFHPLRTARCDESVRAVVSVIDDGAGPVRDLRPDIRATEVTARSFQR